MACFRFVSSDRQKVQLQLANVPARCSAAGASTSMNGGEGRGHTEVDADVAVAGGDGRVVAAGESVLDTEHLHGGVGENDAQGGGDAGQGLEDQGLQQNRCVDVTDPKRRIRVSG